MDKEKLLNALKEIDYSGENPYSRKSVYTNNNLFAVGHLIATFGSEGSMKTSFTIKIALEMLDNKQIDHLIVFDGDSKSSDDTFLMGKYLQDRDATYINIPEIQEKVGGNSDDIVLSTMSEFVPDNSCVVLDSAYVLFGDLIDYKNMNRIFEKLRRIQKSKNLTVFYITHTTEERAFGSKQQGWAFSYSYFVEKQSDSKVTFKLIKPYGEIHRFGFHGNVISRGDQGLYDFEYTLVPMDAQEDSKEIDKSVLKELEEQRMLDLLRIYIIAYISTLQEEMSKTEIRNFIKLNINLYKDKDGVISKRKSTDNKNIKSRFLQRELGGLIEEMYEFKQRGKSEFIVRRTLLDLLKLYKISILSVPDIITEDSCIFSKNLFIEQNKKEVLDLVIHQEDTKAYFKITDQTKPKDFNETEFWSNLKQKKEDN